MKNIIVVYLISIYDKREYLLNFIKNYKNFNSGEAHDLLICFKNFKKDDPIFDFDQLKELKHIKFFDNNNFNDFDWGSYERIAKTYSDKIIFFMNCHSYPVKNNWLKTFAENYDDKSIIGPGGSFESMVNSALNGIHTNDKFKSYLYALSNFLKFPMFPNPHLRSNCFMILSNNFLKFNLNKKYKHKKIGTWINESGRNGMTNFFKKKKFKIYVVNSDGLKFSEVNWPKSDTYACKNQDKLIISDKFSRIFHNADSIQRERIKDYIWGL